MHPNSQLIHTFYSSFQTRNADAMCACYHSNVLFTDPVFGPLRGAEARAMWQMLCGRATDLAITFEVKTADSTTASAHWEARYSFSKSKRPVHNIIEAAFVIQDGQIVQHTDRFDLWRWSRMALGPVGVLLGWTPFLQGKIRADARRSLDAFMKK